MKENDNWREGERERERALPDLERNKKRAGEKEGGILNYKEELMSLHLQGSKSEESRLCAC